MLLRTIRRGRSPLRKDKVKTKRTNKTKVVKKKEPTKDKGQCFHCGKDGHWKRNCKAFLAEKAKVKLDEASSLFLIDLHFLEKYG